MLNQQENQKSISPESIKNGIRIAFGNLQDSIISDMLSLLQVSVGLKNENEKLKARVLELESQISGKPIIEKSKPKSNIKKIESKDRVVG